MEEKQNKSATKKIRTSASSLNKKSKNPQSGLIFLINILNSEIKKYYISTKNCLSQGKQNKIKNQTNELINKYLEEFIFKAKDIFKRMKYMNKIYLIQQEINSNEKEENYFFNKNNNFNKIISRKKLFNEEMNNSKSLNNTSSSLNINNYFQKINLEKNKKNDIKSLNNSSKDIKILNQYNNNSTSKKLYNRKNLKYLNLKRNSNTNSLINLRKKIIFDEKPDNSSLMYSSIHGLSNINSNNNSRNNLFHPKKDIFDNVNKIISLLKEIKSIKGNIFTKSIEAENHKKILKKIYDEFLILIKNIFKENNINVPNLNENNNNTINYKKDINNRNLIIQQLKEELNIKSQKNFKKKNLYLNNNNNYINSFQEENNNKNKTKKIINELQEKINKNQKKNIIYPNNDNKDIEKIKQKYFELEQEKENIQIKNEELNNKINELNQELNNKYINPPLFTNLISQNFYFNFQSSEIINEKSQKIIFELKEAINIYQTQINQSKEEINKLTENNNKYKEDLDKLNKQYNENIINNKNLKENLEELNNNIEKYKKIIKLQEEEIKNLKINQVQPKSEKELLNKSLPLQESLINNNIIFTEEKKSKKRNTNSKISEYQMEQDKIYLKYELLKNDYDKLNSTLIQKQKLLDNYSKLSSETASKTNIDEQILELMAEHKKEIENLTAKYNKNIMSLKMNLPSPFSPNTHIILIDKRYAKYDLKWYLVTVLTENEKNYENTFWVTELEMKPILSQFNKYKTEKELEDEKFDNLYKMQEKWIKQLDQKEKLIEEMKVKINFYENTN